METINQRVEIVLQALKTLNESILTAEEYKDQKIYQNLNDSVIQRFEYSIELVWKLLSTYLQARCIVDLSCEYPRDVIREAANAYIISKEESLLLLACLADRNKSSHAYHERLACAILSRIPGHYEIMKIVVERIQTEIPE